ncbi:PaaI family thioesterase [Aquisalimonas sp.]|uniref:PaaI family thioesterase n=1 Tax=Aquisalimonas sp. TaxID=1872621 RepID=UPI0025BBD8ED|nr:PaaI family thioesterase [Aquisalimonas sp.]
MAWTTDDEIAWNRTNPFRQHLGVHVEWVADDGRSEVSLPVTDNLLQAYGMVHGGIYCVLIDTVLGTGVRSVFQYDAGPITVDLNVSFLRPTGLGRIYARSEIIKAGRKVVVGTADVVDADNRKLATGRGSFLLREGGTGGD